MKPTIHQLMERHRITNEYRRIAQIEKARGATLKCDVCGKFIACKDIENEQATRQMITPDSEYSTEEFETLCREHSSQELGEQREAR